jgi:hypothetical protein
MKSPFTRFLFVILVEVVSLVAAYLKSRLNTQANRDNPDSGPAFA